MTTRARRSKTEVVIWGLGAVLTLVTLVVGGFRFREQSMLSTLPTVGVFFVAIVIGEIFRVTLPGSRRTAPMATAAALAFAMTVDSTQGVSADYKGTLVVAVTAVAMAVGLIPNVIRRKRAPPARPGQSTHRHCRRDAALSRGPDLGRPYRPRPAGCLAGIHPLL